MNHTAPTQPTFDLDESLLEGKKHIHFIGVGGSGMFPLAQILLAQGHHISGSDNNATETLELERKMGMDVVVGQRAENIKGAQLIVYTAAILPDNEELVAAKASGVPVVERAHMLGLLTRRYPNSICVSGTHGKTTTTSMLTEIMLHAGKDPTVVQGGKLHSIGGSGRIGQSDTMVCEACEFADHHLLLHSSISVILNVDADHLDYYGSLENIIASFRTFCEHTTDTIIVNGDDENARKVVEGLDKQVLTFGWSNTNDYYPENVELAANGALFTLCHKGKALCELQVNVPGQHNILNAIAACIAALCSGVTPEELPDGLRKFTGVGRRFEVLGERNGLTIADDYAHHPTELRATLESAKRMPYNKVWAVFQPFTYSRTKLLLDDFAQVLPIADNVILTEIMGGREKNDEYNIYTKDLAEKIPGSVWFNSFESIADYVLVHAQPGDLVITLGCGDVNKCAKMMLTR